MPIEGGRASALSRKLEQEICDYPECLEDGHYTPSESKEFGTPIYLCKKHWKLYQFILASIETRMSPDIRKGALEYLFQLREEKKVTSS